jgi:hypothetical protein
MALPSWRDNLPQSYVGARKWGTGINPVHSQHYGNVDVGRNLAPGEYNSASLETSGLVTFDFGYVPEDAAYDEMPVDLSFMQAHPNLGDPSVRANVGEFPSWGKGGDPLPNGTAYRSYKIGTAWKEQIPQQQPSETVSEGWLNKVHNPVPLDSEVSDESQLYMQTSMVQRDKIKGNESAVVRGTDESRSEIASRIVGMQTPVYSGGQRHEDMYPKDQDTRYRPWAFRTAGTGPVSWMEPNAMVVTEPITRDVPADVNQGPLETADNTGSDYTAEGDYYGDW